MAKQDLKQLFLEDHRRLARGLTRLIKHLERNELREAVDAAHALDVVAGPHMAFEEDVFYPALKHDYGREFVDRLEDEHQMGRDAVKELIAVNDSAHIAPADRQRLLHQLESALDHVLSCGTLVSHLERLPDARQKEMLGRLEALRESGMRWTDRATRKTRVERN